MKEIPTQFLSGRGVNLPDPPMARGPGQLANPSQAINSTISILGDITRRKEKTQEARDKAVAEAYEAQLDVYVANDAIGFTELFQNQLNSLEQPEKGQSVPPDQWLGRMRSLRDNLVEKASFRYEGTNKLDEVLGKINSEYESYANKAQTSAKEQIVAAIDLSAGQTSDNYSDQIRSGEITPDEAKQLYTNFISRHRALLGTRLPTMVEDAFESFDVSEVQRALELGESLGGAPLTSTAFEAARSKARSLRDGDLRTAMLREIDVREERVYKVAVPRQIRDNQEAAGEIAKQILGLVEVEELNPEELRDTLAAISEGTQKLSQYPGIDPIPESKTPLNGFFAPIVSSFLDGVGTQIETDAGFSKSEYTEAVNKLRHLEGVLTGNPDATAVQLLTRVRAQLSDLNQDDVKRDIDLRKAIENTMEEKTLEVADDGTPTQEAPEKTIGRLLAEGGPEVQKAIFDRLVGGSTDNFGTVAAIFLENDALLPAEQFNFLATQIRAGQLNHALNMYEALRGSDGGPLLPSSPGYDGFVQLANQIGNTSGPGMKAVMDLLIGSGHERAVASMLKNPENVLSLVRAAEVVMGVRRIETQEEIAGVFTNQVLPNQVEVTRPNGERVTLTVDPKYRTSFKPQIMDVDGTVGYVDQLFRGQTNQDAQAAFMRIDAKIMGSRRDYFYSRLAYHLARNTMTISDTGAAYEEALAAAARDTSEGLVFVPSIMDTKSNPFSSSFYTKEERGVTMQRSGFLGRALTGSFDVVELYPEMRTADGKPNQVFKDFIRINTDLSDDGKSGGFRLDKYPASRGLNRTGHRPAFSRMRVKEDTKGFLYSVPYIDEAGQGRFEVQLRVLDGEMKPVGVTPPDLRSTPEMRPNPAFPQFEWRPQDGALAPEEIDVNGHLLDAFSMEARDRLGPGASDTMMQMEIAQIITEHGWPNVVVPRA